MQILITSVQEMTPKQYKTCANLTMRDNGMMMYSLRDCKAHAPESKAILALEGEKIVGWVLLIPIKHQPEIWEAYDNPPDYAKRVCKYTLQFYVRTSARGTGVAQRLMEEALRFDPKPRVIPWDDRSASFFADYPVYVDGFRRRLVRNAKRRKKMKVKI